MTLVNGLSNTAEEHAFEELVSQDIKGTISSTDAAMLRHEENLNKWHVYLVDRLSHLDFQLASLKAEYSRERNIYLSKFANAVGNSERAKVQAEFRDKDTEIRKNRTAKLRFKRAVEEKLNEVKILKLSTRLTDSQFLDAILSHKKAVQERIDFGDLEEPLEEDIILWNSITGVVNE